MSGARTVANWREDVPVVVLVDGRTASAAEILAAALADRGRAVVVGSATLGKGLVQTIDPLPDGGELFVTWSRVLAPLRLAAAGAGRVASGLHQPGARTRWIASSRHWPGASSRWPRRSRRTRAARPPLSPTEVLAIRAPARRAEGRAADLTAARALIAQPGGLCRGAAAADDRS